MVPWARFENAIVVATGAQNDVRDCWSPRKRFHLGTIDFHTPAACREWLAARHPIAHNGTPLWASIARTPEEEILAKPFSQHLRAMKKPFENVPAELEAEWAAGIIWVNGRRLITRNKQNTLNWEMDSIADLRRDLDVLKAAVEREARP